MKMSMFLAAPLFTLLTAFALAAEAPAPPAGHPPVGQSAPSGEQPETGRSSKRKGHPMMGMGAQAPQDAEPVSGKVLETMNNGGYSYIHLQKENGDKVWVAVTETTVEVGSRMSFRPGIVMSNFESRGLNRTFDTIIFTDAPISAPKAVKTPNKGNRPLVSPGSKGSGAAKERIKVAKANGPDGITVAEAFANSVRLDKKKVAVRGKVVKVSAGIMKRNWIHIQDGSGSQAKGTHDLVCTSKDMPEVGDVVTVSGTLARDRDFGGGYRYSVIIEDARIRK